MSNKTDHGAILCILGQDKVPGGGKLMFMNCI